MDKNLYDSLTGAFPFFLIAGPCVIEEEALMLRTAETLVGLTAKLGIPFVFKSSFLKANRTSIESYRGPGLEQGLALLHKIKTRFNIPILTDVHDVVEVSRVSAVCDILQIPAFLSRQTALIEAAAQTGRIVNIKKGQFMAPDDMQNAAQKVIISGNPQVMLTERGTTFGYHNLVVDYRGFAIMKSFGYPVIYDVTHSLQKPSEGKNSGGTPQYIQMMAQAAVATGYVDGLFIETHPEPDNAKSDAASMLALDKMEVLLKKCIAIRKAME